MPYSNDTLGAWVQRNEIAKKKIKSYHKESNYES